MFQRMQFKVWLDDRPELLNPKSLPRMDSESSHFCPNMQCATWPHMPNLPVHECEGAVVEGDAHDAHVVGVQHAVAPANTLPLSHQRGGAADHLQCRARFQYIAHGHGDGERIQTDI